MADNYNLKALITAVDKMSPTLLAISKNLRGLQKQMEGISKGGKVMGAGMAVGMGFATKAFMESEDAATQLQNTLMNNQGVAAGFDQLKVIAEQLGNQLPGTTADFLQMASQLKSLGVSTDTIINGALKATAYLAVVGKGVGVTYEQASEAVGKLGNAFGILPQDLVPFADTLQRTLHLGVSLTEMEYAMARLSPRLKAIGQQGLQVADDWSPLSAMLIQTGMTGETAGTGLEKVLSGFAKAGKFKGVENMVDQLEIMRKKMGAVKFQEFAKKQFGDEGERVASLIAAGGYKELKAKMQAQADLQKRINNSLGTLTNLWDAATGTFTNALAAFAESWAPELKQLTQWIGDLSGKLVEWARNNGPTIKTVLAMAGALTVTKLAAGALAMGIGVLNTLLKANPWMLLVQGIALVAPLIIDNWDTILAYFNTAWTKITETWDGVMGRLSKGWQNFINFIQPGIDMITYLIKGMGEAFDFVSHLFTGGSLSLPQSNGMSLPGASRPNLVTAGRQQVGGSIDVNFNNAPPGMRVAPGPTKGPVDVNANVGMRSLSLGLPY